MKLLLIIDLIELQQDDTFGLDDDGVLVDNSKIVPPVLHVCSPQQPPRQIDFPCTKIKPDLTTQSRLIM